MKINLLTAMQGLSEWTEKASVLSAVRLLQEGLISRYKRKANVWISNGKETKPDILKLV